MLAERGLDVSCETVRRWFLEFGSIIAANLRRTRPRPRDHWHLDEMVIVIQRKRKQQRFTSPGSAQRFLNIHSATYNTFYHQRHLLKRPMYKELRTISFDAWQRASMAA